MTPPEAIQRSVDHLFRRQSGQMVASLTRIFGLRHLDAVEDAVQDALVQALRRWPYTGMPDNPAAWLVRVARNRLLDRLRRSDSWRRKSHELERTTRELAAAAEGVEAAFSGELRDDQLRMIFTCCHPAIPPSGQVPLTLKVVGGFSVSEIARAFLVKAPTMAQRLVRAKRRLRQDGVRLEMPEPGELTARLPPVLEVVYLTFNEGYGAHEGEALVRTDLCHEAIRLATLLAGHPLTGTPEVHALAALLSFQGSRLPQRTDAAGELLLLAEQDRTRWDQSLIRKGVEQLRLAARGDTLSTYHLEAEIASCHALAESFEATDWRRILAAYDDLAAHKPSPVVALNRIVALAEAAGAEAALRELDRLHGRAALGDYYPYWATRGELLRRTGRGAEASAAFRRAMELTSSAPVRRFLMRRA